MGFGRSYVVLVFCVLIVMPFLVSLRPTYSKASYSFATSFQGFGTIQEAIDAANEGDTINVPRGIYNESFVVNKRDLQIIGEDKADTIVNLNGTSDIRILADNTTIRGFSFKYSQQLYAMYLQSSSNWISDNVFESNQGSIFVGFDYDGGQVANNLINNNEFRLNSQISVCLNNACQNTVAMNSFVNNSWGITMYQGSARNTVEKNDFEGTTGTCITFRDSPDSAVCNNHIESGYSGIYVDVGSDNSVVASNVVDSVQGIWGVIYVISAANVTLRDNTVLNSSGGVYLNNCLTTIVSNNTILASDYGFGVYGSEEANYFHQIDSLNKIDGKPVYYMVNTTNLTIDSSAYPEIGFLGIVNSTYAAIEDVRVTNNWQGVLLAYTNHSLIRNVTLSQDFSGIDLFQSFDNTLVGNSIEENSYGARLLSGSKATFYHNNFIGNLNNVQCSAQISDWDNGIEGNYWSNYDGVDHNFDGIGDVAFVVGTNNIDDYPLMGLYSCFEGTSYCCVEVVSNSTIQSFQYHEANRTIEMYVFNMTLDQTAGFCRICIPHELVDVPYNVLVNGVEPVIANCSLLSNMTHTWIYFSFQCEAGRVLILPETFWLPCLLLISAVILLGRRLGKRKLY